MAYITPPRKIKNCVKPLLDNGIQSIVGSKPRNDKTAPEESKIAAFTLVEMSIVLIIIGLIVAGISKGRGMIAAAKINAQVQQLTYFEVAYNTFQLKYDAIPGDMVNASDYWPGTANGDGNGRLDNSADNAFQPAREGMKLFTHLSKAKLLKQDYDGTYNLGVGYPVLEIDSGKGMLAGGQVNSALYYNQLSAAEYTKRSRAVLYLNNSRPWANSGGHNDLIGAMTVQQAQTIDKKIDDGIARSGRFKSHKAYNSTQGNCLDGTDGDYLLSNDQPACMGAYILEK